MTQEFGGNQEFTITLQLKRLLVCAAGKLGQPSYKPGRRADGERSSMGQRTVCWMPGSKQRCFVCRIQWTRYSGVKSVPSRWRIHILLHPIESEEQESSCEVWIFKRFKNVENILKLDLNMSITDIFS